MSDRRPPRAQPVILVHLAAGPEWDQVKACTDEPMDLPVGEEYPSVPRMLCPACRALLSKGARE